MNPTRTEPREPNWDVQRQPLAWYLERIVERSYFSYTKINHRFWELELELHRRPPGTSPEERAEADRALGRVAYLATGFRDELLADLASLPVDDPDFLFATSHEGYPGSCRLEGATPDPRATGALARSLLPPGFKPHDGMLFKRAAIGGEIRDFFSALRELPVLVVGPEWLEAAPAFFELPEATHLAIPSRSARAERIELLERIVAARRALGERPAAVLFEAGTLAPWLIRRLHGRLASTFLIDVGRPLDVCCPRIVFRHNWGRVFRRELEDGLGIVDPHVRDSRKTFAPSTTAERPSTRRAVRGCRVEAFERDLAAHLDLPQEGRLVATQSGPAALRLLTGLEQHRHGRPLRWLASAWTDPQAATVSALARAVRVDCDAHGLVDARALAQLDPAAWDGVILSDPFGVAEGFEPVARQCRRLGKAFVVEGFAALDTARRRSGPVKPEALCLAAPRPWGGEPLGLAWVPAEDEALARRLVRGDGAAPCPASESAADRARERLAELTPESTRRHLRYRRIASFALQNGWALLGPNATLERFATPAVVPLISPRPIHRERFQAGPLGMRLPGSGPSRSLPAARALRARLALVPCDPALEDLDNEALCRALRDALPAGTHPARRPAHAGVART